MISKHYALATALLLAIALVPTLIHSYFKMEYDDGRTTSVIPMNLAGIDSVPSGRNAEWVREMFASDDWIERNYTVPDYGEIRLFAARSYDLKRLYHHPELAVLYGTSMEGAGINVLDDASVTPAHLLQATHGNGKAAYTLLYEDKFVTSPLRFQLEASLGLLFKPRKQMTLFLVYDENINPDTPFSTTIAAEIMKEATRSFLPATHD